MQKIPKNIKPGTKVQIRGCDEWYVVTEIEHGKLVRLKGLIGSHQYGHIVRFTNKLDAVEAGFFNVKIDGLYIQCCLEQRKDGKGFRKLIKIDDCGFDQGICADVNKEAFKIFGKQESLNLLLKAAKKVGYKVI